MSSILFGDIFCTQYRVRFYPPFGYSILYEDYNLIRFDHKKNKTHIFVYTIMGMFDINWGVGALSIRGRRGLLISFLRTQGLDKKMEVHTQ